VSKSKIGCKVKKCFACGVLIGPGFVDEKPFYVGKKALCHMHYTAIKSKSMLLLQEFTLTQSNRVLFSDGHVGFTPKVN
jgi:hypothetical protein